MPLRKESSPLHRFSPRLNTHRFHQPKFHSSWTINMENRDIYSFTTLAFTTPFFKKFMIIRHIFVYMCPELYPNRKDNIESKVKNSYTDTMNVRVLFSLCTLPRNSQTRNKLFLDISYTEFYQNRKNNSENRQNLKHRLK